jgi:hypothetical protein
MDLVGLAETTSVGLCSVAVLLWMSIGTFSRTEAREVLAQRVIAALCLVSAALLFSLHYMGGELWGSRNVARPMAVVAVIVALAGAMNIKGKDVQGEANPHKIAKMRAEKE